jgi:hypothetical protein
MELTPEQKRQFLDDGFIVLPQAVAPELIAAAQQRLAEAGAFLQSTLNTCFDTTLSWCRFTTADIIAVQMRHLVLSASRVMGSFQPRNDQNDTV